MLQHCPPLPLCHVPCPAAAYIPCSNMSPPSVPRAALVPAASGHRRRISCHALVWTDSLTQGPGRTSLQCPALTACSGLPSPNDSAMRLHLPLTPPSPLLISHAFHLLMPPPVASPTHIRTPFLTRDFNSTFPPRCHSACISLAVSNPAPPESGNLPCPGCPTGRSGNPPGSHKPQSIVGLGTHQRIKLHMSI